MILINVAYRANECDYTQVLITCFAKRIIIQKMLFDTRCYTSELIWLGFLRFSYVGNGAIEWSKTEGVDATIFLDPMLSFPGCTLAYLHYRNAFWDDKHYEQYPGFFRLLNDFNRRDQHRIVAERFSLSAEPFCANRSLAAAMMTALTKYRVHFRHTISLAII